MTGTEKGSSESDKKLYHSFVTLAHQRLCQHSFAEQSVLRTAVFSVVHDWFRTYGTDVFTFLLRHNSQLFTRCLVSYPSTQRGYLFNYITLRGTIFLLQGVLQVATALLVAGCYSCCLVFYNTNIIGKKGPTLTL